MPRRVYYKYIMRAISIRPIPLLNLRAQHAEIREEALAAITRVIDSQKFILGDEVQKLEQEIALYSQTKFAIGCASGSDALYLALLAAGIRRGDRVITTPFTFFATAGAISQIGATPVFVDVDARTFNLDPSLVDEAIRTHDRVRSIIPVHLFGACADMDMINAIAADKGLTVIEDAAQAIGSEYKGRRAGSLGKIGCFSFFPTKNLGAYGDGGMLTTHDAGLAETLVALRVHGRTGKYLHEWVGINSRLDALQATILRVKFGHLDQWTKQRQKNAELYRQLFADWNIPVVPPVPLPYQTRHVYNQFVIRCQDRNGLQAHLNEAQIGTEVYYPVPLHLQPCYQDLGYKTGDFPVSEQLAAEVLALPVNAELSSDDIEYVCRSVQSFYA